MDFHDVRKGGIRLSILLVGHVHRRITCGKVKKPQQTHVFSGVCNGLTRQLRITRKFNRHLLINLSLKTNKELGGASVLSELRTP